MLIVIAGTKLALYDKSPRVYKACMATERVEQSEEGDFDLVYEKYPRKAGKQAAYKKLRTKFKLKSKLRKLYIAVKNYAEYCKRNNVEKQYIPYFSTFVNSQWEDWKNPQKDDPKSVPKQDYFRAEDLEPIDAITDESEVRRLSEVIRDRLRKA